MLKLNKGLSFQIEDLLGLISPLWSLIQNCENINVGAGLPSKYLSTLANSTLIILFSKKWNFQNYFFQIKKYCEGK